MHRHPPCPAAGGHARWRRGREVTGAGASAAPVPCGKGRAPCIPVGERTAGGNQTVSARLGRKVCKLLGRGTGRKGGGKARLPSAFSACSRRALRASGRLRRPPRSDTCRHPEDGSRVQWTLVRGLGAKSPQRPLCSALQPAVPPASPKDGSSRVQASADIFLLKSFHSIDNFISFD